MSNKSIERVYEDIKPFAEQLSSLFKQLEQMVKDGTITREQYNDMVGEGLDEED